MKRENRFFTVKVVLGVIIAVLLAAMAVIGAGDGGNDKSLEYYLGMVCGIVVAVAVIIGITYLLKKRYGVNSNRYDERQKQAQGKAYKVGFFTLMALEFLRAYIGEIGSVHVFDSFAGELVILLAGVLVFGGVCMKYEAYFSLDSNPKAFVFIWGILGIINIGFGIKNICEGMPMIENGVLSHSSLNIIVGVFVMIFILMYGIIRGMNVRREEIE